MMGPEEAGEHPVFGRAGPTMRGELLKRSDHIQEWRGRWFVLKNRRLWYYEQEADAKPIRGKPDGLPKGYFDTTAAKVTPFEDHDDEGVFFGFELEEEYGIWTGGMEAGGDKIRLCSSVVEARDEWVDRLKLARRPAWVLDDEKNIFHKPAPERPKVGGQMASCEVDMETGEPFTFFNRKHHCRKCGGAFLGTSCVKAALPDLDYPDPVWVCNPCHSGTKRSSRWIVKLPKSQRGAEGKAREIDRAADAVAETLSKTASAIGSFFSGGSDGS
jgi:hypothetical protein